MKFTALLAASCLLTAAQNPPPSVLTLAQAVERASKNYPSVRVSQEQINAAAAGIREARTAYLPRVDALAQVNRATRNNVFGMLLPQSVTPSISGPVLGTNDFGSAWGSVIGGLVSWEPFDFGLRQANVSAAESARVQSKAAVRRFRPALFVPATSVVTTTERTFVIRDRNRRAEWVNVRKGSSDGDLIEVMGDLRPGEKVVRRGTDELRDGSPLPAR